MPRNDVYQVSVSSAAKAMLSAHVDFVARVSEDASKRLEAQILEAITRLSTFPNANPALESNVSRLREYRKLTISKRYIVLYKIVGYNVFIEYVLDNRQDNSWLT